MADYDDRVRRDDLAREMEADTADTYEETEGHATTGGAMAAGAVTGGVIGLAAGPVGAAVGAVGGAIVGAITERVMHGQEGHDHLEGDEDHWEGDHVHTGEDDGHDHSFHYTTPTTTGAYATSDAVSTGMTGADYDTDYDTTRDTTRRGDTVRLHEEQLDVNKERVQAGEVRVGKEVVSQEKTIDVPVTREEVFIERRPVDRRPATDADLTEGETIRVPVMEEEVNVEKRAVVTEEVSVGKRPVQETERVSETVRREEPVIERSGDVTVTGAGAMDAGTTYGGTWDEAMPRFRTSFQDRYGVSGQSWSEYEPRYRFGYDMYNDPRYRGRSFDEVEPRLRGDWEDRHYGSAWDDVKMTVREAWDSLTGAATSRRY